MRIYKVIFLSLLIISGFVSCKKSENKPDTVTTDVYVGGEVNTNNNTTVATIWKNGEAITLPSPYGLGSSVNSIVIKGTDVYAAGYYFASTAAGYRSVACYWKNGVFNALADETITSTATGIAINGNDVYISGTFNEHAVFWKNGVINNLSDNGFTSSGTSAIAINGGDLYFAGTVTLNYINNACYWKNGALVTMPTEPSMAYNIGINGADIYLAGATGNVNNNIPYTATYWKNGTKTEFDKERIYSYSSLARGIAIKDNDVYITGYAAINGKRPGAAYWKNGAITNLTDESLYSTGFAVTLVDTDVYVTGYSLATYASFPGYATLWKNGIATQLSQTFSAGKAVVVVKR